LDSDNVYVGNRLKVAVADLSESTEVVQVLDPPEHAPDHPANVEPAPGVAVSITDVPDGYWAAHVAPQARPPLSPVTVPIPVPAFDMERENVGNVLSSIFIKAASPLFEAAVPATTIPVPAGTIS
jgi:hypothetical protein